jgi:ATP-dependent RNA helicase RhlE
LTTFQDLGLAESILKAVTEAGYTTPTPIQLQAIPPVAVGKDVLGIAQTGTGKTAAFALPILHRLAADRRKAQPKSIRCLVLSPTRELATQIAESFRTYGNGLGFTVGTVFGGVSERPQAQMLSRGVDVLVATPGRLLDHLSQRNVMLSGAEVFVLDEADQMLDLGFFRPIRKIVSYLPKQRQNLFFSATMPKEIEELTRELLNNPVKVAVAPAATTAERVSQRVIHIEQNKKRALLVELLADQAMQRTLVFTRTKRGADRVAKHLVGANIPVSAIHGNKSQNQREAALDAFKAGKIRVLCATDIAARGIDIDEVTHVVNFDLPEVPEAYVHRIGRTARAGEAGAAVAFCSGEERHLLRDIERVTRQQIPSEDRRNDQSLASDKAGEPREARRDDRRGDRRDDRRGGQRPARGDRPARAERPAYSEPRNFGGGELRPGGEVRAHDGQRNGYRGDRPRQDRGGDRSHGRDRERGSERNSERPGVVYAGAADGYRGGLDRREHRQYQDDSRDQGHRPRGSDRPRGDRPHGDRPHGDRPHGDRPRHGNGEHRHHEPRGDRRPEGNRDGHRHAGDRHTSGGAHRQGGERAGPTHNGGHRGHGQRPHGSSHSGPRRDDRRAPHAGGKA